MKRIIIQGPQGCGKTTLVRNLISGNIVGAQLASIKSYDITSFKANWVIAEYAAGQEELALLAHKVLECNLILETQEENISKELKSIFSIFKFQNNETT